nr:ASPIC/UnbV domain-containing protein [bacterium]
ELDNSNHWFQLDLLSGTQNRFGLGARIEVMAGGMLQSRQVGLGAGFMSQNSLTAEFGLGASTELDTLRIFWPSGTVQETLQVAADQRLTLTEPGIPTQADEVPSLKLALLAPYPNPFNPSTEIRFQLPQANSVKASIYDLNGRLVRRLLEDIFLSAGEHSFRWDGRDDGGRVLASGVYLLRFEAGGRKYGRKLVLLK